MAAPLSIPKFCPSICATLTFVSLSVYPFICASLISLPLDWPSHLVLLVHLSLFSVLCPLMPVSIPLLLSPCLATDFQSFHPSAPNFFSLVHPSLISIPFSIYPQSLALHLSFLSSFSFCPLSTSAPQSRSLSAPWPGPSQAQDLPATMSGDYEDDLCRRALILVSDLCARVRDADTSDRCQEFNDLRIRGYPRGPDAGQHPQLSQPAPCLRYSQDLGRVRAAPLSFLFPVGPVPHKVLPPSCLLLVPQTSDIRRRSCVVYLTSALLGFILWVSCSPHYHPTIYRLQISVSVLEST